MIVLMDRKVCGVLLVLAIAAVLAVAGCTGTQDAAVPSSGEEAGTTVTYVVGIDGEYPPYSFIDTNGDAQGFDVESIKWIAEQKGFDITIQPVAWDGIIPALLAGKIDMVYSGMTITPERAEVVTFSVPYWQVNQSVAIHDDTSFTMDEFMAGTLTIGAQRGTTGQFWVEDNLIAEGIMPVENLVTYDSFPLAAEDLKNKRIDAAIYDKPPMLDAIAEKPMSIIGEINTGEEYGVAMRQDDTELIATMNEGLAELMASPDWNELMTKYEMVA